MSFRPRQNMQESNLVGELVGIHWNAHRKCWSIVAFKSRKTVGNVAGYADQVVLEDISFKVDASKKRMALSKGKKERHTFIVGRYISSIITCLVKDQDELRYDVTSNSEPFKRMDGSGASGATVAMTNDAKVYTL